MGKYISVKIPNKDCKGIYLFADTDLKIINDVREVNKLIITDNFKLQLRTKIDVKSGKKVFNFSKKHKTFIKAVEFVAGKRDEVREILKTNGTLIEPKRIDDINEDEINKVIWLHQFIQRIETILS